MAGPVLYAFSPVIIDLPPGQNPAALAWFMRFSSGHLAHLGQQDAAWCNANGVPVQSKSIAWSEYLRLLDEAHWYEDSATTMAAAEAGFAAYDVEPEPEPARATRR